MTEREKMLAGGWFAPRDAELTAIRDNATRLMHRLNVELCGHDDAYRAALRELSPGCEGFIRDPFRCDYGLNISMGEGSFVNFDCVFLDLAPIRIGRHTLIGADALILDNDMHYPRSGARWGSTLGQPEQGQPISIGEGCFIGARATILKGVTIGSGSVVAAGAVVTRDVPPGCLAIGNTAVNKPLPERLKHPRETQKAICP